MRTSCCNSLLIFVQELHRTSHSSLCFLRLAVDFGLRRRIFWSSIDCLSNAELCSAVLRVSSSCAYVLSNRLSRKSMIRTVALVDCRLVSATVTAVVTMFLALLEIYQLFVVFHNLCIVRVAGSQRLPEHLQGFRCFCGAPFSDVKCTESSFCCASFAVLQLLPLRLPLPLRVAGHGHLLLKSD